MPYTNPPITLVIEESLDLRLTKPETAFQVLLEAVASMSQHEQTQILPPQDEITQYNDCALRVANPHTLEDMNLCNCNQQCERSGRVYAG